MAPWLPPVTRIFSGANSSNGGNGSSPSSRDFVADGIADEHRLCAIFGLQPVDLVIGGRDRRGFAGEQAVDAAEHRILFVKHGRDPHRAGGEQRREGRIAAEADDRVGAVLAVEALGLARGP